MNWYHYVACFFAGMFLANVVPHFVKGICGDRFPTPFAKPPGKGLSSPLVNVLWSLLNLLIAYVLARVGRLASVATSAGVEATARSAHDHGYNVTLVIDAMTDLNADAHRLMIEKVFPRLGETATTDYVLQFLA